jgi:hypothetical protein
MSSPASSTSSDRIVSQTSRPRSWITYIITPPDHPPRKSSVRKLAYLFHHFLINVHHQPHNFLRYLPLSPFPSKYPMNIHRCSILHAPDSPSSTQLLAHTVTAFSQVTTGTNPTDSMTNTVAIILVVCSLGFMNRQTMRYLPPLKYHRTRTIKRTNSSTIKSILILTDIATTTDMATTTATAIWRIYLKWRIRIMIRTVPRKK